MHNQRPILGSFSLANCIIKLAKSYANHYCQFSLLWSKYQGYVSNKENNKLSSRYFGSFPISILVICASRMNFSNFTFISYSIRLS